METFLENFYGIFVNGALLDDLIETGLILPLTSTFLIIPAIIGFFFYKVIDSVKYSKQKHWVFVWLVSGALTFICSFATCIGMQNEEILRANLDLDAVQDDQFLFDQGIGVFSVFSVETFILSLLLFLLFSLLLKRFSTNNRRNPFYF
jgi:hypothetical protein